MREARSVKCVVATARHAQGIHVPSLQWGLAMARLPRLTLGYRVALLIAILLVSSAIITMAVSLRSVQTSMSAESMQSVDNIHASVNSLISLEYDNIVEYRKAAMARRMTELADISQPIVSALNENRAAVGRGELTLEKAQANSKAYLKSIRFGNDDYFYAFDYDMTQIAHPDKALQDKNLIDLKDADGEAFVREMRDVALKDGSGFVDYRWRRLGQTEPSPKLAYVFDYAPWKWILGTGVYVDDIDAEVATRFEGVKSQLATTLGDIHFSTEGFFFILNSKGEVVVAPPDHNLDALASTAGEQQFVQQAIDSAPKAAGQTTTLDSDVALTAAGSQAWVVNVSTFQALDWYLVSAVPRNELDAPARSLTLQQAGLTLAVLLIGLISGLLMSRRIIRPVEAITRAARDLSKDRFDPSSLDAAAGRTDEVGELARTFQRMGAEVVARERQLREQVAKLKVQIDHARREEAVREITETEFFSDLTAKAAQMRKRLHDEEHPD
jgi:HAMP domain-containing protein